MRPYNFKVWAIPAENMQCEWLGDRSAMVDLKQAIRSVLRGKVVTPVLSWLCYPLVFDRYRYITCKHVRLRSFCRNPLHPRLISGILRCFVLASLC